MRVDFGGSVITEIQGLLIFDMMICTAWASDVESLGNGGKSKELVFFQILPD